jgi:hypothetical protein
MEEINKNEIEVIKNGINDEYGETIGDVLNESGKKFPDHEKILLGKEIANLAIVLDALDKDILIKRCVTLEAKLRTKDKEISNLRNAIKQMKIHGFTNKRALVNKPGELAKRGRPSKVINAEWTQNLIDSGMSLQEIASVFDMSIYTLRKEIKKLYMDNKITVKPEQFKTLGIRNI